MPPTSKVVAGAVWFIPTRAEVPLTVRVVLYELPPIRISLGEDPKLIKAKSLFDDVQVICDGQRVSSLKSPAEIRITKSKYDLRLVHNIDKHYFQILRKKLYWGMDLRSLNNHNGSVE